MVWRVAQRLSHCERARWKGEGAPPAVCEAVLDSGYRTGYENATPCPERTGGSVPWGGERPDPEHLPSETHGRDDVGIVS